MKTKALTIVRRLFCSDLVTDQVNRANRRKWVKAVRQLGDKWLLANPLQRQEN